MKNFFNLVVLGLMCAMLAGCGIANFHQPGASFATAGVYTDVQGGSQVVDASVVATKTGTACSSQILGIVASGDTSVETAMKNGGITKLSFVNQSLKNIFFSLYTEVCTIARGN